MQFCKPTGRFAHNRALKLNKRVAAAIIVSGKAWILTTSLFFTGFVSSGQNMRATFTPTTFSPAFTVNRAPALTIRPGDTVCTETIDAMGFDQKGVRRAKGGNPLTGPF